MLNLPAAGRPPMPSPPPPSTVDDNIYDVLELVVTVYQEYPFSSAAVSRSSGVIGAIECNLLLLYSLLDLVSSDGDEGK